MASALNVVSMQGGNGDEGYAQNSSPQNFSFHGYGKSHLAQAIHFYKEHIGGSLPRLIRIVDYGCCYGKNTLEYAEFILTRFLEEGRLAHLLQSEIKLQPEVEHEFQYFFVDLPSNDFNNLFCMIDSKLDHLLSLEGLKFYVAGVPRSFYRCVLPKESVDFAITTYSLHWLSQVPGALLDKKNAAWNGDHVWIPTNGGGAVAEAYAKQFQEDARRFLRSRADEMTEYGVMFVLSLCRAHETPPAEYTPRYDSWSGYFEQTWNQLVDEGMIEASERDAFNVPQYNFSKGEFEMALGSVEELELLELHVLEDCECLPHGEMAKLLSDPCAFGTFWASFLRSLIKPLIDAHIGSSRSSLFFDRLESIAARNAHLTRSLVSDLLIAIIRKKN